MDRDADPSSPAPDYGDVAYWESRYQTDPSPFDWYVSWDHLFPVFQPLFTGNERVLNLGCGNSTMPFDMSHTGFQSVTSIDFSPTVIAQMRSRYAASRNLVWEVMDVRHMAFPKASFDIIFDKGTIDSIVCGPSPFDMVERTLREVERVLAPAGLFIVVSLAKPASRIAMFRIPQLPWHRHKTLYLPDPNQPGAFHYVYIFQKMSSALSLDLLLSGAADEDEDEEEEEEEEEEEDDGAESAAKR
jgi:endothelin-converting enzyme